MRILIAPDSFKESLSAKEVALALKSGFENLAWLFLGLGTFLALITVVRIIFKRKG